MASTAGAAARQLYTMARRWDDLKDDERRPLKTFVKNIVGYPCKLACEEGGEEYMEIYVLSERTGDIEDFLEIQASGAVGPMYDQYDDEDDSDNEDNKKLERIERMCDAYNSSIGVTFEDHNVYDEDEGEEEEEEEEEEKEEKHEEEKGPVPSKDKKD